MPHLVSQNPSYQKHRATGQAVVRLNGKDFYLGPHGSKSSRDEYDRLIGEWLANGRRMPTSGVTDITVAEVIEAFWNHATSYYRHPDRTPTSEIGCFKTPLVLLNRLYGSTPAVDFGPLAFEALRNAMIERGWVRGGSKKHPKRAPGDHYTKDSYGSAIGCACRKAWPVPSEIAADPIKSAAWIKEHRWHPHQLRHSAATEVAGKMGIEAAQAMLGHRQLNTTEIYAEKTTGAAARVVQQVG